MAEPRNGTLTSSTPAGGLPRRTGSPWAPIGPYRAWLNQLLPEYGSVAALARAAGVHETQMHRWLRNNRFIPRDVLDDVMARLGAHWTELYNEADLVESGPILHTKRRQ
jgi:hypothetical protein